MTQRFEKAHAKLQAGCARASLLEQWVLEDLAAGNTTLTGALSKWAEDVAGRLKDFNLKNEFQDSVRCRIPWIFVDHLNLAGQRVLLTKGLEVHALNPNETVDMLNSQPLNVKG